MLFSKVWQHVKSMLQAVREHRELDARREARAAIELSVQGGPALLRRTLAAVEAAGVQPAH